MDTKWTLVLFIYFILLLQQGHGFTDIAWREWKLVPHQTSKWNPIQLSGTLTGQLGQSFHQCICREVFSSKTLDVTLQCCWTHLGASAEERQPTLPSPLSALGQPSPWACRLQSFWHLFYLNEINVFVCSFVCVPASSYLVQAKEDLHNLTWALQWADLALLHLAA